MLRNAEFTGTKRFEIKRRLGAGGMGIVYEALDREQNSHVALKTLKRFDAQALYRFKNEFRALQDLEHPNLVSLGELIEEDGKWFFTMELIHGVDFLTHVRAIAPSVSTSTNAPTGSGDAATGDAAFAVTAVDDSGGGDEPQVAPVLGTIPRLRTYDETALRAALKQLAMGIAALHVADKVHRDVKPKNILVTREGRVVLLDFGLVVPSEKSKQSKESSVAGTAAYMAPEQATGEVTPSADWYSVGVVLYEALTGRLPHSGKTALDLLMKKQSKIPAPPRQRIPSVPEDLDQLCVELLRIDPKDRPSGLEILESLGVDAGAVPPGLDSSASSGFTQTTPFVGREDELKSLRAAFYDSKKKPVVVMVEGESGLGKSELVRQFAGRLTSDVPDAVVLAGRCYERESVAYKALDGIVDELSRYMTHLPKEAATALLPMEAGLLPRLFPVLQRVEAIAAAPREAEIPDPQEMRRRMFGALRELFARLAKRRPLVLVIDDLQWTDIDSLSLLREIMGDVAAPNLLLVATMRPVDQDTQQRILASISTMEVRHIDLTVFSFECSKELAAIMLPSLDDEALAAIANEAAGHPLFVMELAREAEGHGYGRGHGVTLDQTLWQRISQLPADLLTVLQILCVAGAPITQETAANAAEMSPSDLSKAASGLRISYLARTGGVRKEHLIEPYHDRIREIVSKRLSDATREHYHRRLAIALAQSGAAKTAPQALVRHAEAAGDVERAAEYAEAAAEHAIEALAFDRAAEFFQTALRLGDFDAEKTRALRVRLAGALADAGRGPEAAAAFVVAAEGAESETRLECNRQAASQWLKSGHIERGLDAMRSLLTQIDVRMPTTPRRALRSLLWQRAKIRFGGLKWKEKESSDILTRDLTRIDLYQTVSQGLGVVDTIRGADFQSRGLLLALATGERFRVARALLMEGVSLASQGNVTRGQKLADRSARIHDDPYLRALKSGTDGTLSFFASRYRPAADHFSNGELRFRAISSVTWELSTIRLFLLWSLRYLGAFSEMVPLLDEYLRDAIRRGDLYTQTTIGRSCHIAWLIKDDIGEAHRVLEQGSWAPPEGNYHIQHWFEFRARRETDLYTGRATGFLQRPHTDFADLQKSMLSRVITIRIDGLWLRGRLALVSEPGSEHSTKLLKTARKMARLLEREKNSFATAAALLLRAAIAVHRGDLDRAISILATAVTAGEKAGLLMHAASARRRLGELLGGDEGAALIVQADEWMAGEGIVNPERMTEVYVPGFPS